MQKRIAAKKGPHSILILLCFQSSLQKNLSAAAAAALLKNSSPIQPFSMWANRVNPPVNPYNVLANNFSNNLNNDEKRKIEILFKRWKNLTFNLGIMDIKKFRDIFRN